MKENLLLEKFQRYVERNQLIDHSDKILLTVSGGVDSMVMMRLFVESGYNVGVAHCNFQLRGNEAEEDEESVAREAARFSLPFYNRRFDTKGEMELTGESVQMAARRLRYEWFEELCTQYGYTTIAIAHHADDSIETFFINLLRGTGLKGLTGIHSVRGHVIRPLLFASRKEILDYALTNRVGYREDSSNRSTKYLRNKIRLGIVPRLREINPKFTELMSLNIKRLTDAQIFINRSVELIAQQALSHDNGFDMIDPSKIDSGLPLDYTIYEILNSHYGFKGDIVDQLCDALSKETATGKRFYSKDYVASIDRGHINVAPIGDDDTCQSQIEAGALKCYCGNSVLTLEYLDIDNVGTLVQPENIALLDADKLQFPLHLRRWQEGDNFIPFGMSGRKKVSDYLIDTKVPLAEKGRQFILLSGDEPVWLVGRRIDDRFRIGPDSENVLKITREII